MARQQPDSNGKRPDSNGKQKRTVVLQHAVIQLIEKTGALPGLKKQGAA